MAAVKLVGVQKSFGVTPVLRNIDLDIHDGEFMVFVGPSGCGKSTLLRVIAGLEHISGGNLSINGGVVNDVPPAERGVAMVFQSYALYPHRNMYDEYGLRAQIRQDSKSRNRCSGHARGENPAHRAFAATQAQGFVGRPAPAGRDRSRDCSPTRGLSFRRTLVESRRRVARSHALRIRQTPRR